MSYVHDKITQGHFRSPLGSHKLLDKLLDLHKAACSVAVVATLKQIRSLIYQKPCSTINKK